MNEETTTVNHSAGAAAETGSRSRDAETEWPEATVVELLDRAFEVHADQPAVRHGATTVTYAQLDEMSAQVAGALADRGVRVGSRVGIAVDRSVELIAGVIGILRAGAAYVPLDPGYPAERLEIMSALADLDILLTEPAHAGLFTAVEPVLWDELMAAGGRSHGHSHRHAQDSVPVEAPSPADDAYVIFTSGSTGEPKGVRLPHRALANLVEWQLARATFRHGARVLQYTSISFDVSFQEIATTIASGGELVLVDDTTRRDPRLLLDVLIDNQVERLFVPFVALRSLVDVAVHTDRYPTSLVEVITAGEQLRVDDTLRRFFAGLPDATLDNQYGPSESHVVTAHLLEGDPAEWPGLPPIGRPLTHNSVHVLDERGDEVAPGTPGELYLAGRNLAHGYLGRDDLTALVFVVDTRLGERLYRTGDLVERDRDGTIRYIGRIDHQVKIRGHRVEPEEVNVAASRLPGVGQCLTKPFQHPNGTAYLCTYVVASPGADLNADDVRRELRTVLPDHLVPAFVFRLDAFATGASGKADLRQLPHPADLIEQEDLEYADDIEASVARIFADVLGLPGLDSGANFFDVGGDSLAAVTVFLRIDDEFGVDLPLATIASAPTVDGMAAAVRDEIERLDGGASTVSRSLQLLQDGADTDIPPLFLVHGGKGNVLYFREFVRRLDPAQTVYAFQWPGWDGGRGPRRIPELARTYVDELRAVRPHGPYRLGGHCIGGLIALEMAEILLAAGEEIDEPLVVSDAPNLAAKSYRGTEPDISADDDEAFRGMVRRLHDAAPTDALAAEPESPPEHATSDQPSPGEQPLAAGMRIAQLPVVGSTYLRVRRSAPARRLEATAGRLTRRARIEWVLRRGRRVPVGRRQKYCQDSMIAAARHHRSSGTDLDVIYFRTFAVRGREMALEGWWDDTYLGFRELCRGDFEFHIVGGGHSDALNVPRAAARVSDAFGLGRD